MKDETTLEEIMANMTSMGQIRRMTKHLAEMEELRAKKLDSKDKQGHELDSSEQSNKREQKDME